MSNRFDLRTARDAAERDVLLDALAEAHGMVTHACLLMGISRASGYKLIKKHGLIFERMTVARVPPPSNPDEGQCLN